MIIFLHHRVFTNWESPLSTREVRRKSDVLKQTGQSLKSIANKRAKGFYFTEPNAGLQDREEIVFIFPINWCVVRFALGTSCCDYFYDMSTIMHNPRLNFTGGLRVVTKIRRIFVLTQWPEFIGNNGVKDYYFAELKARLQDNQQNRRCCVVMNCSYHLWIFFIIYWQIKKFFARSK